ncbi:RAB6-interacting golgin [Cimex lectularius]|uniref:RAB6-interacting golgin n=1 Tax=Cimex lectularius TaxID=79782 RepID=A0A8I6R705_CIMLE|nr:RAB6-interacting golgin [Cimex lectularius]
MADGFYGFTDSDLRNMVGGGVQREKSPDRARRATRAAKGAGITFADMPEQAKLSRNTKETLVIEGPNEISLQLTEQLELHDGDGPKLLQSNCIDNVPKSGTQKADVSPPPDLDEFEERRKQLEIKNAKAKEELQKALQMRAQKTKEEVKKLNLIESELKEIDAGLTNDIAIIRNRIEKASMLFLDAQKRFDKAEKEYNTALASLMKAKENKMLLTSHLCSIIEQNELKKSKKLSELMEKLDVSCESLNQGETKSTNTTTASKDEAVT